ncbi:MAG TPA: GGDEF domain-containing protein [Phycisphaerales bacterium]|nr:GGDEF domain-containing protein [Phycisphaerales bacterium]
MAREMDSLTGLLKEEWLKQGLEDELNRAERFGRDLGLLMLEPDIPEELVRDLSYPVLKKLGNVSKEVTRQVDVGVRIRNRLLWLLPETSEEGVQVATQKIAEKFSEHEFVDSSSGEKFKGSFRSAYFVFPSQTKDRDDILNRLASKLEVTEAAASDSVAKAESEA